VTQGSAKLGFKRAVLFLFQLTRSPTAEAEQV
jgi:hypothetical protein